MAQYILAGDCGGTNTRLLLYQVEPDMELDDGARAPGRLVHRAEYKNECYESFEAVVKSFLSEAGMKKKAPLTACFAVAGPVYENAVEFTNRDWSIDGNAVEADMGIASVRLVNDFVANGYGLLTLDEGPGSEEVVVLQDAPRVKRGVIACIGAGTGLGECYLTPSATGYDTYPSEGGHTDYAPRTDLEIELLEYLKAKFAQKHRVSNERVVSGIGIANIYEFLTHKYPDRVEREVNAEIDAAGDNRGGVIAKHASPGSLCNQAIDIMVAAYGSEAGNLALKLIPLGGLYLTGGITPKNIDRLTGDDGIFMRAYRDKGRVSPLLLRVPVKAVMVEDLGQRGAHWVAFKLYAALIARGLRTPRRRASSTSSSAWGIVEGDVNTDVALKLGKPPLAPIPEQTANTSALLRIGVVAGLFYAIAKFA